MSIKRLCQWRDAAAYLRVTMALLMMSCIPTLAAYAQTPIPQTVYFPSADGKTELVGYLFTPVTPGPYPAVVMLHGRGGPYSANINAACSQVGRDQKSPCDATNLSKRHMMWGEYWAAHGYVALHVDSFGPRGRGHGYGRGTHGDPDRDAVNELTVRPLDATGALTYLVQRKDILPNHVMLQGWSNGGSTALNVMLRQTQSNATAATPEFRAALAFYPGCGPRALASQRYQANSPIWIFWVLTTRKYRPLPAQIYCVIPAPWRAKVTIPNASRSFGTTAQPTILMTPVLSGKPSQTTVLRKTTPCAAPPDCLMTCRSAMPWNEA